MNATTPYTPHAVMNNASTPKANTSIVPKRYSASDSPTTLSSRRIADTLRAESRPRNTAGNPGTNAPSASVRNSNVIANDGRRCANGT